MSWMNGLVTINDLTNASYKTLIGLLIAIAGEIAIRDEFERGEE